MSDLRAAENYFKQRGLTLKEVMTVIQVEELTTHIALIQ